MKRKQSTKVQEFEVLDSVIRNMMLEVSPSSASPSTFIFSNYQLEVLLKIAGLVIHCSQSTKPAAHIIEHENGSGRLIYAEWIRPYKRVLDDLLSSSPEDFKNFHCGEEINCFFKAQAEMETPFELKGVFENHPQPLHYLKAIADALNSFILLLRQKMNSPEIKKAIERRKEDSKENLMSCRNLINGMFSVFSKLTVLRIDLAFKPTPNMLNQNCRPSDLEEEFHSEHNLEILKAYIARLLRNKRHHKILKTIVGYIFKFEYGLKKGFHVHAIFF